VNCFTLRRSSKKCTLWRRRVPITGPRWGFFLLGRLLAALKLRRSSAAVATSREDHRSRKLGSGSPAPAMGARHNLCRNDE
jgi:hypothetical protein